MVEPALELKFEKYLRTRAVKPLWTLENCCRTDFTAAVVIPALAEYDNLPRTLATLAQNPPAELQRTLMVIVVNQRASASAADKADNQKTLAWLKARPFPTLNLAWVDACQPGSELADREGVGLARKIGFDLALPRLDRSAEPLLISLDADSLVTENYLATISAHFQTVDCVGAYLPFRHQPADSAAREDAIRNYELYLRSYQFGLQWAGSPYAFIALGSAFACRAQAYLAAGGMKRRQAGEDFYFLQQLAKIGKVVGLSGTQVRPASRYSERVPFGTGRALAAEVENGRQLYQFVSRASFQVLKNWLLLLEQKATADADIILSYARELSPLLAEFLAAADFLSIWQKLQQHSRRVPVLSAFHQWFDGLRTRQLLMCLEAAQPPQQGEQQVSALLAAGGYPQLFERSQQLSLLESLQGVVTD